MIILGYNGFSKAAALCEERFGDSKKDRYRVMGHDSAAAIFKDGTLIAAAEEERFSRVKKTSAFPKNAVQYCLDECGITLNEVDYFAIPWNFDEELVSKIFGNIFLGKGNLTQKLARFERRKKILIGMASPQKVIEDFNTSLNTCFDSSKFLFVPHHHAHIMTGYYMSGMEKSAFLVSDARGENTSSVMGEIDRNAITLLEENTMEIRDSIGILYMQLTRYLGFTPNSDEYKVMALSAFVESTPDYDLSRIIEFLPEGRFKLLISDNPEDDNRYEQFFHEFFGERSEKNDQNAAYAIQKVTEMAIWHQVKQLQEKTSSENLFLEGGVVMNCVNNGEILKKTTFKAMNVGFATGDCGVPIGAAFYPFYQNKLLEKPSEVTPYTGPSYTHQDILAALENNAEVLHFHDPEEELLSLVINHLMNKKVIGWFQGKMEYGARALGNRSILASPAFPDIKEIINAKVKHREGFRPFAGAILEEEAGRFFSMGKKPSTPYMTVVYDLKPGHEDMFRGALHVDNTSRLQTVTQEQNPTLYNLIAKFYEKSGVPCLINTSFNVQGEPIVCNPSDAIQCFLGTQIDVLVLGKMIVYKK